MVGLGQGQVRVHMTRILPPAAKGTRTLTGRWGQVCACAAPAIARTSHARRTPHAAPTNAAYLPLAGEPAPDLIRGRRAKRAGWGGNATMSPVDGPPPT